MQAVCTAGTNAMYSVRLVGPTKRDHTKSGLVAALSRRIKACRRCIPRGLTPCIQCKLATSVEAYKYRVQRVKLFCHCSGVPHLCVPGEKGRGSSEAGRPGHASPFKHYADLTFRTGGVHRQDTQTPAAHTPSPLGSKTSNMLP